MCRLLAIPSGFSRPEALQILLDMQGNHNVDGVGSVYVDNGTFHIVKYPHALSSVLKKRRPFLEHLPHKGWTLIHLRAASHGSNTMLNTHPFEVGDWCVAHNGVWSDHSIAAALMEKLIGVKCEGQTDTEVAVNVLNVVGPERFTEDMKYAGVFIGLKRDGDLWVMKTSGDMEVLERDGTAIISSEFDGASYPKAYEVGAGCYHFAPDGKVISKHRMKWKDPLKKGRDGIYYSGDYHSSDEDYDLYHEAFAKPFTDGEEGMPREEGERRSKIVTAISEMPSHILTASEKERWIRAAMARGIVQGPNAHPPEPHSVMGSIGRKRRGTMTPRDTKLLNLVELAARQED